MKKILELPVGGGVESNRLDIQYKMWIYVVGGFYPAEIKDAVDQYITSAKNPVILDLGCGPALWSTEVAEHFPSAQVIGLDITPPGERPFPSNFSFKQHDLTAGLPPEFKASGLDIVHCRMVLHHLPDPQAVIDSVVECLKPGGFLIIVEGSLEGAYNEHKNLMEPFIYDPALSVEENLNNPKELSWHSGCLHALGSALRPPTYQPPPMLVKQYKTLKDITAKDYWMPIYWEGENLEYGKELKEVGIVNLQRVYGTASRVFLKSDIPAEITNALLERGFQEASGGKTYLYASCIVARKE